MKKTEKIIILSIIILFIVVIAIKVCNKSEMFISSTKKCSSDAKKFIHSANLLNNYYTSTMNDINKSTNFFSDVNCNNTLEYLKKPVNDSINFVNQELQNNIQSPTEFKKNMNNLLSKWNSDNQYCINDTCCELLHPLWQTSKIYNNLSDNYIKNFEKIESCLQN